MPLATNTKISKRTRAMTGLKIPAARRLMALAALLVPLFLTACDGAEEREAAYFERGKALYEEGKYTKAVLEFKNARQINPLNMEALYYLGLIAEKKRNYKGAFGAYMKITEQNPKHVGANIHSGRMMLASGETDQALTRAERALEVEPNNADAHALHGAALLRLGRLSDARTAAMTSRKLAPNNVGAVSVLVGVLQKERKTSAAIALLEDAIVANSQDRALRLLLIEIQRRQKNISAVEKVYDELFKLDPKNHSYRVDLARILIVANRHDDAESVLRQGIVANPSDDRAKLILVDFFANQRSLDAAEKALLALINESPKNSALKFGLAQLYAKHNKMAKAEAVLRAIATKSESKPEVVRARTGLARLRLSAGDTDGSSKLLDEILGVDPSNGDALTARGRIHLQRGRVTDAIADFRRVLRDNPNSKEALEYLANAHIKAGEVDLATENLRLLVSLDPQNDAARLRLARMHAGQRGYDKALALTDEVLARQPESAAALRLKGDILLALRKIGPAMEAAERLRAVDGDKAAGYISVGRVHQAEGQHEKAVTAFKKALKRDPNSPLALTGLVRSYLAMKRSADAIDFLKTGIKTAPENVYAHNLLGEVYAFEKVAKKAEKSFLQATTLRRDWTLPYINLGRLMVAQKRPDRAVEFLKKGLESVPDDPTLRFTLASAQQAAKDYDAAVATYETILQRNPKIDAAANNIAAILADQKFEDPESLDTAFKMVQRFQTSNNPFYLDTLGWVHYRKGDYSLAVVFLKRAAEELPSHPYINYHLAMAYIKSGQRELSRQHLEKAVVDGANYPEVAEARTLLQSM